MLFDIDPKSEQYSTALKKARTDLRLTQEELANSVGISKVMIGRYETEGGKKNAARPSPSTAFALQSFFSSRGDSGTNNTSDQHNNVEAIGIDRITLDDLLTEIRRRGYKVSLESIDPNSSK